MLDYEEAGCKWTTTISEAAIKVRPVRLRSPDNKQKVTGLKQQQKNMSDINKIKTLDGTAGKKKTITYAYMTSNMPIDTPALTQVYYFIEFDVPYDQPVNETALKSLLAAIKDNYPAPDWKFVTIPDRYWHLDKSVILEYLIGLEDELPPSEWKIPGY